MRTIAEAEAPILDEIAALLEETADTLKVIAAMDAVTVAGGMRLHGALVDVRALQRAVCKYTDDIMTLAILAEVCA